METYHNLYLLNCSVYMKYSTVASTDDWFMLQNDDLKIMGTACDGLYTYKIPNSTIKKSEHLILEVVKIQISLPSLLPGRILCHTYMQKHFLRCWLNVMVVTCASNTFPVWQTFDGSHSTKPCEMSCDEYSVSLYTRPLCWQSIHIPLPRHLSASTWHCPHCILSVSHLHSSALTIFQLVSIQ